MWNAIRHGPGDTAMNWAAVILAIRELMGQGDGWRSSEKAEILSVSSKRLC